MSRGMASGIVIEPDVIASVRTLAMIPALAPTVIAERNFDVLNHQRLGVIKDSADNFEGGRSSQKWVAARLRVFGRRSRGRPPVDFDEAYGEAFGAERDGVLKDSEFGGSRSTDSPMAIPIAPRFRGRGRARFDNMLQAKQFVVVGRRGLLIDPNDRREDQRTEIAGILTKRVNLKPRLGFFRRWHDKTEPKALAKYGEDLDLLLTESGREILTQRVTRRRIASLSNPAVVKASLEAGEREYQKFIKANPGNVPGARAAKRQAIRAVRRDLLERVRDRTGVV